MSSASSAGTFRQTVLMNLSTSQYQRLQDDDWQQYRAGLERTQATRRTCRSCARKGRGSIMEAAILPADPPDDLT
jgi:hypothetical protein